MYKEAYSIEIDEVIDAEKAYELYWEDLINDVHDFICSEEGCTAQLTLSSVNKERRQLKQVPHFRCFGEHKNNCPNDENNKLANKKEVNGYGVTNRTIEKTIDNIHFERLKRINTTTNINKLKIEKSNIKKRYHKEKIQRSGKRESDYYTIIPIVTKYINYKKDRTLYDNFIVSEGKKISYGNFFISLNSLNTIGINKFNRIYFGMAKIYKLKDKDNFRIVFRNKIKYNEKRYTPRAFISEKIINSSYKHNKWLNELQHHSNTNEEVMVFILGKPRLNTVTRIHDNKVDKIEKEYFNIEICRAKLDLLDIRVNKL